MGRAIVKTVRSKWTAVCFRALLCQRRDRCVRGSGRSCVEHWPFALDVVSDERWYATLVRYRFRLKGTVQYVDDEGM
jgi:hypothetical protein